MPNKPPSPLEVPTKLPLFDPVNWVTLTRAELVEAPTVDISIIVWLLPVIVGGILLFSALT